MALMYTIIAKNNGVTDVMIEDLGVLIEASSQFNLSDSFTFSDIACSDDLRDLVDAETLVINDGTSDLSKTDGLNQLSLATKGVIADLESHTSSTSNPHQTTLDQAYDGSGSGAGRTVTVDQGSVKLDAASSAYAPLELSNLSSAPSTGLAAGQLAVIDGLLYCYDATRSKWLSVQRNFVLFGKVGNTRNQYLRHFGGEITSNVSGQRIMKNATIVGMSGQLDASGTTTLSVRKNDSATDIASLSISAATGDHVVNTNIDMSAGDFLQGYCAGTATVASPVFIVEYAYRA